jgi:Methyltransferase domain
MVSFGIIASLLADPVAAANGVAGGKEGVHRFALRRLTGAGKEELEGILNDLDSDRRFSDYITAEVKGAARPLGEIARPRDLYVICRALKPEVVIETGVASGMSSAYILKALDDNAKGRLYSIDLPNADSEELLGKVLTTLPDGRESGWLVPPWLRGRWTLKIGKSSDILPDIMKEIDKVDIFLHDSEHSFENMMFEFQTVWPKLKSGGLILSDDVDIPVTKGAFYAFARSIHQKPMRLYSPIGAVEKK